MVITTPGHGLIFDTVMLHGIVRHLAENNIYDGTIERVGDRYKIEIDNIPPPGVTKGVDMAFRLLGIDIEVEDREVDLTRYLDPHVCEPKREPPPVLSLKWYNKVCDSCLTLAGLGILYGLAHFKTPGAITLMTFAPHRAALRETSLQIPRLAVGEIFQNDKLPLALALYLTSMHYVKLDGQYDLITWRVVDRDIKYFRIVSLNRFVEFAANLNDATGWAWRACVMTLIERAPDVLNVVAEYALTGGDVYRIAKELNHVVVNDKDAAAHCELDKIASILTGWRP
ncbi:MAG: hypothetical protein ACK4SY_09645 [Pyrobaculum sp.]